MKKDELNDALRKVGYSPKIIKNPNVDFHGVVDRAGIKLVIVRTNPNRIQIEARFDLTKTKLDRNIWKDFTKFLMELALSSNLDFIVLDDWRFSLFDHLYDDEFTLNSLHRALRAVAFAGRKAQIRTNTLLGIKSSMDARSSDFDASMYG
ncbi:MAG: hypothetical protein ACFFER_15955 [Candidatus Thorarchaeota archaeon]